MTFQELLDAKDALLTIKEFDRGILAFLIVVFISVAFIIIKSRNNDLAVQMTGIMVLSIVFLMTGLQIRHHNDREYDKALKQFESNEIESFIADIPLKIYPVQDVKKIKKDTYRVEIVNEHEPNEIIDVKGKLTPITEGENRIVFVQLPKDVTDNYPKGYYRVEIFYKK